MAFSIGSKNAGMRYEIQDSGKKVRFFGRRFRLAAAVVFRATAARMSVLKASSSIASSSLISMARLTLPSRLALNRSDGSSSAAPLEGQLHDTLIRLAGADDPVMRPDRDAPPLLFLDHFQVSLLDERVDVIPTALSADRYCCPLAPGKGSDLFRHLHELVPRLATGIDDRFVAWPDLMTEPVLAHEFPHVLSRVQFGCIRRQGQQHDVVGQRQPR